MKRKSTESKEGENKQDKKVEGSDRKWANGDLEGHRRRRAGEMDGWLKEHERTVKDLDTGGKCSSPFKFTQL